tara:strand:+ start:330 stop:1208 length:879 start_codon:yes stop_codon:yes gene_type:complete
MTYFIGKQPTVGNFIKLDALTASATASYTMQYGGSNYSPESVNHMLVSLNGIIQEPTTSYTISSSTLTFASALTSSDSIDFIMVYGDVLNIGTPSDSTISTAKIIDDAVTSAKIADDAVTQAKLSDESVNEARLQVSNSPTNGYFLSAQSSNTGGLTWAEAGGGGKLVKVTLSVGSGTTTASGTTVQDHTSIAHTMESSDNILLLVGLGTANRGSAGGGIYCDIYDDTNSAVLASHRASTGSDEDELPLPTVRVAGYSGAVTFKTRCSSLSGGNKVMLHAGEGIALLELDDS